eukprot:gene40584-49480_t
MDQFASSIAHAIGVLFSQSPSWSPSQKQEANTFILEAVLRPEAFHALLMVLAQPGQPVIVQFFAVNLLLDKVRKGWQQLSAQDQSGVVQQLVGLVSSLLQLSARSTADAPPAAELQAFRDRAVLALCAAAVRQEGGVEMLAQLLQLALSAPVSSQHAVALCLEILAALTEEAEAIDASRAHKQELRRRCVTLLHQHAGLLEALAPQLAPLPSPSSANPPADPGAAAVLRALLRYLQALVALRLLT